MKIMALVSGLIIALMLVISGCGDDTGSDTVSTTAASKINTSAGSFIVADFKQKDLNFAGYKYELRVYMVNEDGSPVSREQYDKVSELMKAGNLHKDIKILFALDGSTVVQNPSLAYDQSPGGDQMILIFRYNGTTTNGLMLAWPGQDPISLDPFVSTPSG